MFQSGTNSNLLDASRSYPGPFLPQREQIGRPFARGSMSTSKKGLLPRDFDQSLLFVDEGLERLDTIENTLEMHPAVAPAKGLSKQPHLYRVTPQDASFSPWPARQGGASRRRKAAARWPVPQSGGPHQIAETATRRPISIQPSRALQREIHHAQHMRRRGTQLGLATPRPIQEAFLPTDSAEDPFFETAKLRL